VLFTSGSTGTPKAVAVPHRAVVRVTRCANFVQVGPEERVLHAAPLAFDASTFEVWWPLTQGATLVIAPPGLLSFDDLATTITRHRVTTLWLTAALFDQYVRHHLPSLRAVRQLLAGGDVLSPAAVQRFTRELPECRLINGYGPTECTTFAVCGPLTDDDAARARIPLGRPIAHTAVRLLDEHLGAVPVGAVGELCIAGAGLARGYLGDPAAVAERFVPDPHGPPGTRLYRTGDLARQLPDGRVDFLGRADAQLKIRGFRVEPQEVEGALLDCASVVDAAVVALDDGDGKQLCAVVVPAPGAAASVPAWRSQLAERLPPYLVPQRWHIVDSLPLTASGKVDRRAALALAASVVPQRDTNTTVTAPALTDTERLLQGLWREVVPGIPEAPNLDGTFFDMGGTSLRLLAFHAALTRARPGAVSVADLFKHPSLRQLAQWMDRTTATSDAVANAPPASLASLEF
jgi:acyl-coenzyme A synthetase/AMP-(fatty) acid ligase